MILLDNKTSVLFGKFSEVMKKDHIKSNVIMCILQINSYGKGNVRSMTWQVFSFAT